MRFSYAVGLLALMATATPASAQEYVRVTGQKVNIRAEPGGTVFAQARSGDLFKLGKREAEWFGIVMFSGEYRYIHTSLAQITNTIPPSPSEATRRQAFQGLLRAEDRAVAEADRRIPPNSRDAIYRNIDLQRLLDDEYKLDVFHRFGMVAAQYSALAIEGIQRKWMP